MSLGASLQDARVLITGAGRGIGRQLALAAATRSAREVLIWDVDEVRAHEVAALIRGAGVAAQAVTVDVTDSAAVTQAASRLGAVDVLINNAGVVQGRALTDATEAEIRRTFEVNTLALYWMTRAFLPGMMERNRGTVVTVASAAGLVGVARQTDYSPSKFAAVGFAESLRAELRRAGSAVRSVVVCPYYVTTGMFDGAQTRFPLLLPFLSEQKAAANILRALDRGQEWVAMPFLVRLLPWARVLPLPAFDAIMDGLGVNHTMDHFTGRTQ